MMQRTHENVLAEMLEKVLAYNISGDHPGAEEAFRATRDGTSSGLRRSISISPESLNGAESCLAPSHREGQRPAKSNFNARKARRHKKLSLCATHQYMTERPLPLFGEALATNFTLWCK